MEHAPNLSEQVSSVNWIDFVVLATLIISGVFAMKRGFVAEAMGLICWMLAIYATIHIFPSFQPWMREQISSRTTADAAAALVIFIIALVIMNQISNFITAKVPESNLSSVDRSLGFVFGMGRGLLMVSTVFLLVSHFWDRTEDAPKFVQNARTLPLVQAGAEVLDSFVPDGRYTVYNDWNDRDGTSRRRRASRDDEDLSEMALPRPALNDDAPNYNNSDSDRIGDIIMETEPDNNRY